jgi:hypothetical protein
MPSRTLDQDNSTDSPEFKSAADDLDAMREAALQEEEAYMVSLQESRPLSSSEAVHLAWLQNRHNPVPATQDDDPFFTEEELLRIKRGECNEELTEADIEEILAGLDDGTPSKNVSDADAEPSKNVSEPAERPSKNVSDIDDEPSKTVSQDPSKIVSVAADKPSKIVSEKKRQSLPNDGKTVAKMRSFRLSALSAARTSSVSYPSPSLPDSTTPPKALTPPTPANDNIPVWPRTGELVTAVCAAAALQIDDNPAIAFTFNLTPGAIADAMSHPAGFLDALKRSFDQNLRRAGIDLPYFFAVDIADDGRLHLHGAFRYPAPKLSIGMARQIRTIMKNSWGEWIGPGKHKQLHFQRLRDDDWATYCMRNSEAVQKIIGPRSFTITHPLGREAKWAYEEIRRIMKGDK